MIVSVSSTKTYNLEPWILDHPVVPSKKYLPYKKLADVYPG